MKHVLFLLHGMGRHEPTWGDNVVKAIKKAAKALKDDPETGFVSAKLVDAVSKTEFVPLYYDDLMQQFVKSMVQDNKDLLTALKLSGYATIAKKIESDSTVARIVRDHVFDVLIYGTMSEHRFAIRKHVTPQLLGTFLKFGATDVRYMFVAHSLGTAVAHDTLHEIATERDTPLGVTHRFSSVMMLANTSSLLRSDYDPRHSTLRPKAFPSMFTALRNVSHKWDPVAQLFSYESHMKNSAAGHKNLHVNHFLDKNIHGYTHYLDHPLVHAWLFYDLYKKEIMPVAFRKKLERVEPNNKLVNSARQSLEGKVKNWINSATTSGTDRSDAILSIARFIKEAWS